MFFRDPVSLARAATLIAIFCAVTVHASTIKLRIVLDPCDRAPKDVRVVMNNDENEQPPLDHDQTYRIWTGKWEDKREGGQFPDVRLSASVRLGGARTDCEFAGKPEKDDHGVFIAVFKFACDQNPTSDVTIKSEPFAFRYVRFLKKSGDKTLGCDCTERSPSLNGTQTLLDTRLPMEVLRLGLEYSASDAFWIQLNDLPVIHKPRKGIPVTLDHDGVVDAIVRSTPGEGFGPNAHDIVKVNPQIKPDTRVTLTVN